MKKKKSYVDDRRNKILEMLNEEQEVHLDRFVEMLKVSPITIRRDLQLLEDNGQLRRIHGGAVSLREGYDPENTVESYRNLVARFAAQFVSNDDTIFINSSQTALKLLEYIDKENVTVITNNAKAITSKYHSGVRVTLTGGELQYPKNVMVGNLTTRTLTNIFAKKAFIGCSGVTDEKGMMTEILNEVAINEMMINHATKDVYLLADHTKIGHSSSFSSCPIEKISVLITDELAPEMELVKIRKRGVKVCKVRKNG